MKTFSADWWWNSTKKKSQITILNEIDNIAKKDGLIMMGAGTGLFIGSGVDIDCDVEIRIHHIKECATAYIDKRTAGEMIDHLKKLYDL